MLNEEQTSALIKKAKSGDGSAKETLVSENVSLIKCIVKRYLNKGVEYDDLFQLACMGFLKAIAGYNEAFETKFSTYAVPMIAGEIKRFMRDDGSVKVSRAIKQTAKEINGFISDFSVKNGRKPALSEIAAAFSIEESEAAFLIGSSKMPLSLQSDRGGGDEEDGRTLMDTIASGEGEEELLDKLQLKTALASLCERDRKIIFLRYFRDKTQSEVAGMIGVSQVQISRIESRILKDFKERMRSV